MNGRATRLWPSFRRPLPVVRRGCGSTSAPAAPELKRRVSSSLALHPLLAEDLVERDQRAKLEQVGELLHLVMFALGLDDGEIYERELDFVLDRRFLLTTHSVWWNPRATRQLRAGVAEVLAKGTDYLLWALADDIIDAYFPILDGLGDEIDDLEDQVVARSDRALLERLFDLKRQLIQVRRVTSPQREMFNILSSREDSFVSEETRLYYRDAYDHLIRLTDELDTYRELASATLEAYLSTVNNNLSLIMKRLTGVTVVVAGIGAVAGIFGMSEAQNAFRLDEGPGLLDRYRRQPAPGRGRGLRSCAGSTGSSGSRPAEPSAGSRVAVLVLQSGASGQTLPLPGGCESAADAASTPIGWATTWSLVDDSNGPSDVCSHSWSVVAESGAASEADRRRRGGCTSRDLVDVALVVVRVDLDPHADHRRAVVHHRAVSAAAGTCSSERGRRGMWPGAGPGSRVACRGTRYSAALQSGNCSLGGEETTGRSMPSAGTTTRVAIDATGDVLPEGATDVNGGRLYRATDSDGAAVAVVAGAAAAGWR